MTRFAGALLVLLVLLGFCPAWPGAARAADRESTSVATKIREGFHYRVETLAYGTLLDLKTSTFNPNNLFGFPRYQAELDVRPDLDLDVGRLRLGVKPRLTLARRWFEEGRKRGATQDVDSSYVNAWQARLRVTPSLFLSYDRENLQWGPSYLISPSNPFNRGNGQNNPRMEQPGLDYARAVWIPAYRWSFSMIANTGRGRLSTGRPFERRYALKTDYTGQGKYASLILSKREDGGRLRAGGFAGWSASDALLLHAEGDVEGGVERGKILTGAAYTFEDGSFAVIEYFHDGTGCAGGPIWQCHGLSADFSDVLVRRNYFMLQFTDPHVRERIHVTARWIYDTDDRSHRFIGIYEQDLGDAFQLFAVGGLDRGRDRDEFGSIASGALMMGFAWVY